jgi:4-carboxymuconolactone decarboxylase
MESVCGRALAAMTNPGDRADFGVPWWVDAGRRRRSMDEYLPEVYLEFTQRYPEVAQAQGELARTVDDASPFDERTTRLLKLALAVGAEADGAVKSNVRKCLAQDVTETELRAVALLAITTCGFPSAIAGLRWVDEVLARDAAGE